MGRQAIRVLFVNQVITVPNIGPFMFICIDSSLPMNRFLFFWNVVCNVRHRARSFGRILHDRNGTVFRVFRVLPKNGRRIVQMGAIQIHPDWS
jgi:hypothetical protein